MQKLVEAGPEREKTRPGAQAQARSLQRPVARGGDGKAMRTAVDHFRGATTAEEGDSRASVTPGVGVQRRRHARNPPEVTPGPPGMTQGGSREDSGAGFSPSLITLRPIFGMDRTGKRSRAVKRANGLLSSARRRERTSFRWTWRTDTQSTWHPWSVEISTTEAAGGRDLGADPRAQVPAGGGDGDVSPKHPSLLTVVGLRISTGGHPRASNDPPRRAQQT